MVLDNKTYIFPIANISTGDNVELQAKSVTITENGTTRIVPDSGKALSSVTVTVNVANTNEFPLVLNVSIPSAGWINNSFTLSATNIPELAKVSANSDILLYPNVGSGSKFYNGEILISSIQNGQIVLSREEDTGDLSIQIIILN